MRKNKLLGGLLRYGIPDFKMEKYLIDRRIDQMHKEGISFKTSVEVGNNISMNDLKKIHDAVLLCSGSEQQEI